jgi:hypothetical protein
MTLVNVSMKMKTAARKRFHLLRQDGTSSVPPTSSLVQDAVSRCVCEEDVDI